MVRSGPRGGRFKGDHPVRGTRLGTTTRVAVVLAVLVAAAGLAGAQAPDPEPLTNPWLQRGPLNIAHGGGIHEGPANTLFAIKNTTLDGPADGFEVDLHRTADGHVVAMHDPTVDRTTNESGAISEMTLDQVKDLDAAYWWVPGNGTDHDAAPDDYVHRGVATGHNATPPGYDRNDFRVPTLREILETVTAEGDGTRPYMILEIKATSQHWRPMVREVADLLQEFERTDGVIVASFNDASTSLVKSQVPEVSTSPGLAQSAAWWASTQEAGPGSPLPQHDAVQLPPSYSVAGSPTFQTMDQDKVEDAHRHDLAAHVWTINDRNEMGSWLDAGVDGIFTDRPTTLDDVLTQGSS